MTLISMIKKLLGKLHSEMRLVNLVALFLAFSGSLANLGAVQVKVSITTIFLNEATGSNIQNGGWYEFKIESDEKGEQATGHVYYDPKNRYQTRVWTWDMGSPNQNIWFWWDTLIGVADLKVEVNGVTVFQGRCANGSTGESSVEVTAFDNWPKFLAAEKLKQFDLEQFLKAGSAPSDPPRILISDLRASLRLERHEVREHIKSAPILLTPEPIPHLPASTEDKDLDGIPDLTERTLLERFRPFFRFSQDGGEEDYRPVDVLWYLRLSVLSRSATQGDGQVIDNTVMARDPFSILNASVEGVGKSDITKDKKPTYFHVNPVADVNGLHDDPGRHGNQWSDIISLKQVGLYGHVAPYRQTATETNLARFGLESQHTYYKVEYWQFFGYNSAGYIGDLGDHEGDWTTVQIVYDPATDKIVGVALYAHGIEFWFDNRKTTTSVLLKDSQGITFQELRGPNYSHNVDLVTHDLQFNRNEGEIKRAQNNLIRFFADPVSGLFVHPMVYIEHGTHEFFPCESWDYYAAPRHDGNSRYCFLVATPPNLGEVEHPLSETQAAPLVLRYNGYWGTYSRRNDPPRGPPLHDQWLWPSDSSIKWLLPHIGF